MEVRFGRMQELRYGQTPTRVPFSTTGGDGHDDTEGEGHW